MRPSSEVRAAFGAIDPAVRLTGGRGTAWKYGEMVLKPLDLLPEELLWLDRTAREHSTGSSIRLSLPIKSRSNQLIVDGWMATPHLGGEHQRGRWTEIASIARDFADLFSQVKRPAFIDMRTDAWAKADRFAWHEDDDGPTAAPHVAELINVRRQVFDSPGIIHGDLTGNVLFDPADVPAVIDLTIYWRPTNYSVAIIAIDAVCFEDAPLSLLETISPDAAFPQYLVRALLFRIATDWLNGRPEAEFDVYDAAVDRVLQLATQARATYDG